jgi:hypothetical protein
VIVPPTTGADATPRAEQHTPPAQAPPPKITPRTDAAPKREGRVDRRG